MGPQRAPGTHFELTLPAHRYIIIETLIFHASFLRPHSLHCSLCCRLKGNPPLEVPSFVFVSCSSCRDALYPSYERAGGGDDILAECLEAIETCEPQPYLDSGSLTEPAHSSGDTTKSASLAPAHAFVDAALLESGRKQDHTLKRNAVSRRHVQGHHSNSLFASPSSLAGRAVRMHHHSGDSINGKDTAEKPSLIQRILPNTVRELMKVSLAQILPSAVRLRIEARRWLPSVGSLLTGSSGSGKTAVLQEVLRLYRDTAAHARCMVRTKYCDCSKLRGKPLDAVLQELTGVFDCLERGNQKVGTLIALDNLDAICPAIGESGAGSLRDERASVMTVHVQRLMQECFQSRNSHAPCSEFMYTILCEGNRAQKSARTSDSSDSGALRPAEHVSRAFGAEEAISKALKSAVYVIASAASISSLAVELFCTDSFDHVVDIEALKGTSRFDMLMLLLEDRSIFLMREASGKEKERIIDVTEGYRLCDVATLARRIITTSYQRVTASAGLQSQKHALKAVPKLSNAADAPDIAVGSTENTPSGYSSPRSLHSSTPSALNSGNYSTNTGTSTSASRLRQRLYIGINDVLEAASQYTPIALSFGGHTRSGDVDCKITWHDIGGYERVKAQILETIKLPLIFAPLFRRSPVRLPRALLLYGPPGCGKTLLAQAAGSEFGKGFISVRGPQLLDKYIGASEKAVRDLFERAMGNGKATLLFFDEFESLAPCRGKDNTGVTDRIVNQLLTFIDGVESTMSKGNAVSSGCDGDEAENDSGNQLFIIAATSRPDLVDAALLRPGRIEKHIYVGLPDTESRRRILNSALQKLSTDDLDSVVDWMVRHEKARLMSPADWRAMVNTAFLKATHRHILQQQQILPGSDSSDSASSKSVNITDADLRAAFLETRSSMSPEDLAYYESVYSRFKSKEEIAIDKAQDKYKVPDVTNQKVALH